MKKKIDKLHFLLIIFFVFRITSVLSQNLIINGSFESKNDVVFSYALAHKALANWNSFQTFSVHLGHPSDALYVDTTLFVRFKKQGFPITPIARKSILQPIDGNCYIKSNSFHKILFTQKLSNNIEKNEAYIVRFAYQVRSFSDELKKINTAFFGVSFSISTIEQTYFRSPKFSKIPSKRFRELHFISHFNPKSNSTWTISSFSFIAQQDYSNIYFGNHTDFATDIIRDKSGIPIDNVRASWQESFLWFIDDINILKLTDFLNGNFKQLKNSSFDIPIAENEELVNNKFLNELVSVLKRNEKDYNSIHFFLSKNNKISDEDLKIFFQDQCIAKSIEIDKTLNVHQMANTTTAKYTNLKILIK